MTSTTNPLDSYRSVPTTHTLQTDYILLDGSSSMQDKWWDTLDSIQAYVDSLKANNVNSQIILQTFDTGDIDCVQRNVAIGEWVNLRDAPIGAHWGMTPLYDAVNVMGRRLRDLNPPRCHAIIATDGEENASKTNLVQAKSILDWMRAKGYQITFIGVDFSNSRQARLLGANDGNSIGVSKANLSQATAALGIKRAKYGLYGDAIHYSEAEQQKFGGYLAGSK